MATDSSSDIRSAGTTTIAVMTSVTSSAVDTMQRLRSIVGPQGFLDQPADVAPFTVDHRKLYRGATPLVLRPDSTAQVAAIMKLCNDERIGVVPVGGNTSYCGGATPSADGSQVVLSLARMRRVRTLDPANYTLIAEAHRKQSIDRSRCARTTPVTTCAICSSARKAPSASSPRRRANFSRVPPGR